MQDRRACRDWKWNRRVGILMGSRTSTRKRTDQFPSSQRTHTLPPPLPAPLLTPHPHCPQVSVVALGTFILWFGWLAFNGMSAFGANLRAVVAIWNSMMAAAFGGMTWCLLDYRVGCKFSMVGFCSGTIAGLVAATPASGYIPVWAALIMGIVAGAICNFATKRMCLLRAFSLSIC